MAVETGAGERSPAAATLLAALGADADGWGDAVTVAAVARQVDARMLSAARPGLDGATAEQWLRGRPDVELRSRGVALAEPLRQAVIAHLQTTDPLGLADLRIALADHLYERALDGERGLLADMAELIGEPQMRAILMPPRSTLRARRPAPGDREALQEHLGHLPSWPLLARWYDELPLSWLVIRDTAGVLCGAGLVVHSRQLPEWVREDPLVGRWAEHAETRGQDGSAVFLRESHVFGSPDDAALAQAVISTGNHHLAMEMERDAVRYGYAAVDERGRAGAEGVGYRHVPELDPSDPEDHRLGMVCDYGRGGVIAWGRDLVYRSHGRPSPSSLASTVLDADHVRAALRALHDPARLAANPVAQGATAAERAEQLQIRLRRAATAAFGDREQDRLDAELVRLAYVEPIGGHEAVLRRLHLSRATYFRRLAGAVDRITIYLSETR